MMDLLKCGLVAAILFVASFQVCEHIGLPFMKVILHSLIISLSTASVFYNSDKKKNAETWKSKLGLDKHPLGGFFKETFRSDDLAGDLPKRYGDNAERKFVTQIAYLVSDISFTQLHKLNSVEIWNFVDGDPMSIYIIDPESGELKVRTLGRKDGCDFTVIVPAGCYHASCLATPKLGSYSLASVMVCPGFEPADAFVPTRSEVLEKFPQHRDVIMKLTREENEAEK